MLFSLSFLSLFWKLLVLVEEELDERKQLVDGQRLGEGVCDVQLGVDVDHLDQIVLDPLSLHVVVDAHVLGSWSLVLCCSHPHSALIVALVNRCSHLEAELREDGVVDDGLLLEHLEGRDVFSLSS